MPMIKTKDLIGAALDWAVAKSEGWHIADDYWISDPREAGTGQPLSDFNPSTDWSQGGPIIEREKIQIKENGFGHWFAKKFINDGWVRGKTPLLAAMRSYVLSKLGDTVEIPSELI